MIFPAAWAGHPLIPRRLIGSMHPIISSAQMSYAFVYGTEKPGLLNGQINRARLSQREIQH